MSLTATNALFDLNYLALAFGVQIAEANVEILTTESDVAITTPNQITVSGTPVDFSGFGTVGWYRKPEQSEWSPITFIGKNAVASGLQAGDKVCVMYNAINNEAREIVIPENIIPSEFHAELRQDLMLGEQGDISSYSKAGELVIDIPRFQMNADQTLTMSAAGASTTNLSGNALVTFEGNGCENDGYYGKIKEVIYGRKFYEDMLDIAIAGGTLEEGDFIVVRGIKPSGTSVISPANLQYTVAPSSNATIDDATGEITNVTGACTLTVKLKDTEAIPTPYNTLEAVALIVNA